VISAIAPGSAGLVDRDQIDRTIAARAAPF